MVLNRVHLEHLLQVDNALLSQLEAPGRAKYFLADRLVIPELLLKVEVALVAEMVQDLPARLPLLLLDELLHDGLEGFEVEALADLFLVVLLADHNLLQCCDVVLLQALVKYCSLQIY